MVLALLLSAGLAASPSSLQALPAAATSVELVRTPEPRLSRPLRMALEGVAAGALSGLALYSVDGSQQPSGDKVFLGGASLALLAPLTVMGTGWLLDSDGAWWGAWLGLVPGVLVGSGLAFAGAVNEPRSSTGWSRPLVFAGLMTPGLFSALGYELAGLWRSHKGLASPAAPGATGLRLVPSLGWAPVRGQRLAPVYGLTGSF